ncbi:c-type cytochrome [Cupriavidus basilensis]
MPDRVHGKAVYAAQCASCHGAEGQGTKNPQGGYIFPPVWGKDSFNVGAGMARMYTAAAFVKHNMPLGQGGTLSAQDAVDVAAYFTQQPRPDYAARVKDWPKGDRPKGCSLNAGRRASATTNSQEIELHHCAASRRP